MHVLSTCRDPSLVYTPERPERDHSLFVVTTVALGGEDDGIASFDINHFDLAPSLEMELRTHEVSP